MRFFPDLRALLRGAWSVWLLLAVIVTIGADIILGLGVEIDRRVALGMSVLVLVARVTSQDAVREWVARFWRDTSGAVGRAGGAAVGAAGVVAVVVQASAFIMPWEGRSLTAYRDIVGVWTICDGETLGVGPGDEATAAECDRMLERSVRMHAAGLAACVPAAVERRTPEGFAVAVVSWTYNIGVGAACKSTLVRKWSAGDFAGACNELPRWNRAGGRVVRGLTNRRGAERDLCIASIRAAELL